MNKVIRIDCFQTTANYRIPSAIEIQESYVLPPYSTIIGMIHNICGFSTYHPMNVSVQGSSYSKIFDMYTRYVFGTKDYDETRHNYKNDDGIGIFKTLGYTELMLENNLIIHVQIENEEDYNIVLNALKNPKIYPSLGRYEDLLRIDNVSEVELVTASETHTENDMYVPMEVVKECYKMPKGTIYNICKNYDTEKAKKGFRKWQKKEVKLLVKNTDLYADDEIFLIDKSNEKEVPVFLV